jgi:transposase
MVTGIIFYDVTALYFETNRGDDLRKTDFSREGRQVSGILMSLEGYPLSYGIFEGNRFEGHTMLEVVNDFAGRYNIEDATVVADAGLMNDDNIRAPEKDAYRYITGARIKNETEGIKNWILSQELNRGDFCEYPQSETGRPIICYSGNRAEKDRHNREKGIKRLEKLYRSGKLTKSNINK